MDNTSNRDFNKNSNFQEKKTYDFKALEKNKYRDKNGEIREELIMEDAVSIAKIFGEIALGRTNKKMSNSQIRAFFGEVKALEGRINYGTHEEEKKEFSKIYPFILMLNSKVEYKFNKEHVTEEFKRFINTNVNIIREENKLGNGVKAFKDFVMFFETVVGFFKGAK